MRIFKNRLLREEINGGWRMLHTDKFHYLLPHQMLLRRPHQKDAMAGHVGIMGNMINA